jgi:hypothetical protein
MTHVQNEHFQDTIPKTLAKDSQLYDHANNNKFCLSAYHLPARSSQPQMRLLENYHLVNSIETLY